MKRYVLIAYEIVMIVLVITSIVLFWFSNLPYFRKILWIIWLIFFIDVAVRFYLSRKKLKYMYKNPFDIVSIIPLDDSFLLARFSRVIRLFRLKTMLTRYARPISNMISKIKVKWIILLTVTVILLNTLIVWKITEWDIQNSFVWVVKNFMKFPYEQGFVNKYVTLIAIEVKLLGVVLIGILIGNIIGFLMKRRAENSGI